MSKPEERNGPKGISDLIVSPLKKFGKLFCDLIFLKIRADTENTAPIQKLIITADEPFAIPSKKVITKMYFMSPKPIHRPLENRKMAKNGKESTIPEIKSKTMLEKFRAKSLELRAKTKKVARKGSGIMK